MQRLSWEQGVATHAAIEHGLTERAAMLARDGIVRQAPDGRLGGVTDGGLVNGATLGEALVILDDSTISGSAAAVNAQREWILEQCPRSARGALLHLEGLPEVWVDTVYMVVPFLVSVDASNEAMTQYRLHREVLVDSETGLWGHRYDDSSDRAVRAEPWATGNGWVAAGIARTLGWHGSRLASEYRAVLEGEARALLSAVAPHERADGRFHNVLTDDRTFVDGTAGMMYAYAALRGIDDGWLDESWTPISRRWRDAALRSLQSDGTVTEVCGAPHFDRQGTSVEAQAFALMSLGADRDSPRR